MEQHADARDSPEALPGRTHERVPGVQLPVVQPGSRVAARRGYDVFNPAENTDDGEIQSRAYYMRLDIPALLGSQAVVLLPEWEQSRGANLEVWIALDLDLPVYRAEIPDGRISLHLMEDLELPGLPFGAGEVCAS